MVDLKSKNGILTFNKSQVKGFSFKSVQKLDQHFVVLAEKTNMYISKRGPVNSKSLIGSSLSKRKTHRKSDLKSKISSYQEISKCSEIDLTKLKQKVSSRKSFPRESSKKSKFNSRFGACS